MWDVLIQLLPVILPLIVDCLDKPNGDRSGLIDTTEHMKRAAIKAGDPWAFALAAGLRCMADQPEAKFRASCQQLLGAAEAAKKVVPNDGIIEPK